MPGAFARGLRDAGVLPVLKALSGTATDRATRTPRGAVSTPPLDQLMTSDLVPYQTLTAQAPVAVAMGHLEVPGLTGDTRRA